MVVSHVGPASETDLLLPTGWKFKTIVGVGSRGKKIVYYEAPSGYLYRSPESVLSHMRTSGLYSRGQISEFQKEVTDLEQRKTSSVFARKGVSDIITKRKSEDDTLASDKLKVSRISDLQSALKGLSDLKDVDILENEVNAEKESLKSCKVVLPRLRSEQFGDHQSDQSVIVKNMADALGKSEVKKSTIRKKSNTVGNHLKLEDMNLKYKSYVEVLNEQFVPEGWKVVDIPHFMPQNEGMTISMRRFVNPKGITFSRSMACGYLEKHNDTENFEVMKKGLLVDGWGQNDQFPIPDGFYFRRHSGNNSCQFIRPDWGILKGMKKYKEYLVKHNYDQKYIENAKVRKTTEGQDWTTTKEEKFDNQAIVKRDSDLALEENHFTDILKEIVINEEAMKNRDSFAESTDKDSFPDGWKVNPLGKGILIIGPDGNRFTSRRHALEFMLNCGVDQSSIARVWRTLSKEGWQEAGNLLPSGWRISKSSKHCKFLNREMKILVSSDEAVKYLQNDKSYDKTDLKKFLNWVDQNEVDFVAPWASKEVADQIWQTDSVLPDGWMKLDTNSDIKYKDSTGNIFEDKIAAIGQMIAKVYRPEEIFKLWDTLGEDGWILDKNLPTGWRRKQVNTVDNFLSPMMEVFDSWTALTQYIFASEEFSPDEVSKVKRFKINNEKCRSL
eukprot:GFUD01103647.1.p1 GENE.GFUD01103647.1~~GFUD01103647.1.p1  ORF type:complete len:669 (+),score=126.41 GFUD01103647.1:46-2052(+)